MDRGIASSLVASLPPRYRVEGILSEGERGTTFEVFDTSLRQTRAVLKVQRLSDEAKASDVEGDFRRHCARLVSIQHDRLAVPYTFGTFSPDSGGTFGYTTRGYVAGTPLSGVPLPIRDEAAVAVALQVCQGLDALHRGGFLHCDLKPENVIVRRATAGRIDEHSQCVLIDFGYRPESTAAVLTEVTLQYVAPEMLEGKAASARSDLYAVGVMLYRLVSGRFPFAGDSLPDVMRRQRARECPPIASLRPGAAPGLCRVVERLLEPNPANRPESAQALMALLGEFAEAAAVQLPATLRHGALVGREAELSGCVDALDLARPSTGVSSIDVRGDRGVGVTSFLRELQDRLEALGAVVLTATPRAAGGVSLQDQLRGPVHALARRRAAPPEAAEWLGPPATSTDLLDDILVAAQERRVVLFVDDAHLGDVAETLLLQRLVLQDKASLEGMSGRRGRCQVILGTASRAAASELDRVVAKRVVLEGLSVEDTARLISNDGTLTGLHAARIHAASDGCPGTIRVILEQVASHPRPRSAEAIDAALASARAAASDRESEIRALLSAPHGLALLALSMWGEELSATRWDAIAASLGGTCADDAPIERIERSGERFVRSRHRHLGERVSPCLGGDERSRIGAAVLDATWDQWRSRDSGDLLPLLRFVARLGTLPARCHWRTCRALILLLERGRFSEVESITSTLKRFDGSPWWVDSFHDAARSGSTVDPAALRAPPASDLSDPREFFRSWVHARVLLRARHRQEALGILEALSRAQFPHARAVALAVEEDLALAVAEVGAGKKLASLRKSIVAKVARWLPYIRRQHRMSNSPAATARVRAWRRVARYQRVRGRAHLLSGNLRRALAACRRERVLVRADGNMLREASCLNNEGLLLTRLSRTAASATFERCVRLRERLDDEQGLVIALNNLAAALSAAGSLAAAAATLNRARVVATRNNLRRMRNSTLVNLASAYHRRGQLRDAQRALRQVRRRVDGDRDVEAQAIALFNGANVSIDRWNPVAAEIAARDLDRLRAAFPDAPQELTGDLIRAELTHRSRDWAHLQSLMRRMTAAHRRRTVTFEQRLVVESGERAVRQALQVEHAYDRGTRLRLMLLRRRRRRITMGSLRRVLRFARRHSLVREATQWLLAHLEREEGDSDAAVDVAMTALSSFELREGHEDLQIEMRARLSAMLRRRGRHAEAWQLVEDALVRFRRLERRLRRWPRGVHLLLHLQEQLQRALTGSPGGRPQVGQEMSASLCAQAFDFLMEGRRKNADTHGRTASALVGLGAALSRGADRDAFLAEVLAVAIGATGAERAVLITGTARSHNVRRVVRADGAEGARGGEDVSWAVVSQVLASGESSLFSDALAAEELASHRSIAALRLRSLACIPLRAGGSVLGALYLDHHGIAGLIGQDMVGLLELLAGLIAISLQVEGVEAQAGQAQRRLAETNKHIMRAERNRLAGELAAGLVHDLKNVLAAVSGRAQLLRRANQEPQVLRSLDAIEKAAGTGVGLVQRLQECARDHSSQGDEDVDLVLVAQEALELLEPRLERNRVKASVQGTDAVVCGVPGEYREMFLNLFVNACDAMPDGGALEVAFASANGEVEVTVGDTGVGMSAETRTRMFEPFFTTKGNRGTGLGLVVVRSVVVRRGGSIAVESALGAGTRFRLRLPLRA